MLSRDFQLWSALVQAEVQEAAGELEAADTGADLEDVPAPAVPAVASGDVEKAKKKRKKNEADGPSGSKDPPSLVSLPCLGRTLCFVPVFRATVPMYYCPASVSLHCFCSAAALAAGQLCWIQSNVHACNVQKHCAECSVGLVSTA